MTRIQNLILNSTFVCFACALLPAHAQWPNWGGGTSSDWNDVSNWQAWQSPPTADLNSNPYIVSIGGNSAVLDVVSVAAGHHNVQQNGHLIVQDGGVIAIDNSSGPGDVGPAWAGQYRGLGVAATVDPGSNGLLDQTGGSITSSYFNQGNNLNVAATGVGTVNQTGGYFGTRDFNVGGNASAADSVFNANGGTLEVFGTGRIDLGAGATAEGVLSIAGSDVSAATLQNNQGPSLGGKLLLTSGSLTVSGAIDYDDPDGAAFSVGGALNLGDATHIFDHGLTIVSGGTIGTGNNSATQATIDNTGGSADFTLQNGATIDYSIRGTDNTSDTLTFLSNADADFGTAPTALNLVVDVVAGDVKQTAGPFAIFDFGGAVPTGWDSIAWTITTAEGTRLSSPGSVIVGDGLNGLAVGEIGLSGFEAFSIPEPSTAMLVGMGVMVMLLRRRVRK